jgi:hypothetical protein
MSTRRMRTPAASLRVTRSNTYRGDLETQQSSQFLSPRGRLSSRRRSLPRAVEVELLAWIPTMTVDIAGPLSTCSLGETVEVAGPPWRWSSSRRAESGGATPQSRPPRTTRRIHRREDATCASSLAGEAALHTATGQGGGGLHTAARRGGSSSPSQPRIRAGLRHGVGGVKGGVGGEAAEVGPMTLLAHRGQAHRGAPPAWRPRSALVWWLI